MSPKPTQTKVGRRRFAFSRSRAESVGHRPVGLRLGAGTDAIDAPIVPTKLSKITIGRAVWPDRVSPILSDRTFSARGFRPQVHHRLAVPSTAWGILRTPPGPVNTPAVIFRGRDSTRPTGCGEDGIRTRYP